MPFSPSTRERRMNKAGRGNIDDIGRKERKASKGKGEKGKFIQEVG
jgi:hypothetical protein